MTFNEVGMGIFWNCALYFELFFCVFLLWCQLKINCLFFVQEPTSLRQPGEITGRTVLNVFGPMGHGGRWILDSLKACFKIIIFMFLVGWL